MEDLLATMKKVGAAIEALDKALETLAQAREALRKIGNLPEEGHENDLRSD